MRYGWEIFISRRLIYSHPLSRNGVLVFMQFGKRKVKKCRGSLKEHQKIALSRVA